ncbi:protein kinase, putative [Plasmodium gaboni]|uniref:Protein kinase, putative n=1 Tax=Plasmodium gaboni TaxID=647221 RepID=A0ABY1UIC6_9APIC|nr:protein kinase, putative [Plasmodium gaboni]
MLQYFVNKLFGDLPSSFNYMIGKKIEYDIKIGYYEMYEGHDKNCEEVCVFIYEKNNKETTYVKRYIKNHLSYSKKLIHPNILKVLDTYENEKRIYIVTEKCVPLIYEKIKSDPIWGLYEIMRSIHFINSCNYIHGLINPLSIFVNSKGRWKLSNFDCIHEKNMSISNIYNDIKDHIFCSYGYKINIPHNIHSTYIDCNGLILLMIWSYKKYICSTGNENNDILYRVGNNIDNNTYSMTNYLSSDPHSSMTFLIFNVNYEKDKMDYIPHNLHEVYNMLSTYNCSEINLNNILNDENLKNNNYIVRTMLFLTEIHMRSKIEKSIFLDNLFEYIDNISLDVKVQMILPELCKNIDIFENYIKCLKIILHISKDITSEEFEKMIYGSIFLKCFHLTDRTVRYLLLEYFPFIEKHLNHNHMNEIYKPYIYGFMDNNMSIKNETIKNFIYLFPKLKTNIRSAALNVLLENLKENDSCIKTNCIICIAKISKHIITDKQNILENVFQVGIHDMSIQTKVATLHSIKYTYDQFCMKKFVSNILPMVTRSMIDDNMQIRSCAFDVLESLMVDLKKELLLEEKEQKDNQMYDPQKSYNFIDKIKGIITKNKGDIQGDTKEMTISGGELQTDSDFNERNEFIPDRNNFMESIHMNGDQSTCPEKTNTFDNNRKDILDYSQYDNINNDQFFVDTWNPNNIDYNLSVPRKNIKENKSPQFISDTILFHNKNIQNNVSFKEQLKEERQVSLHNNKNNMDMNSMNNMNNMYVDVSNINHKDSFHDENKSYNSFKSTGETRMIDKRFKNKIHMDIDNFFDEFDLSKENNTPKIKLSSLQ